MVAHPGKPGVLYTFPIQADSRRYPPDVRCRVYRSTDAGATWQALTNGLPPDDFYPVVLRDAMCADDAGTTGVYFGTRSGEVYGSPTKAIPGHSSPTIYLMSCACGPCRCEEGRWSSQEQLST